MWARCVASFVDQSGRILSVVMTLGSLAERDRVRRLDADAAPGKADGDVIDVGDSVELRELLDDMAVPDGGSEAEGGRGDGVDEAAAERRRLVRDPELGRLAVRTGGRLRDELASLFLGVYIGIVFGVVSVALGIVRVGALDLDEALAADGLVAAPRVVQIGG